MFIIGLAPPLQYTCGEESIRLVKDLLAVSGDNAPKTRERCYQR